MSDLRMVTAVTLMLGCRAPDARELPIAPTPWVVFHDPAFTGPGLPHGGPDWIFATPRLPAISPRGDTVLVSEIEVALGGAPNLRLEVRRVSDGSLLSSHVVLTAAEFTTVATTSPDVNIRDLERAFAELSLRVRTRLASAEASLSQAIFQPMVMCRTDAPAYGVNPPCSMSTQRLTCPELAIRYEDGALDGRWQRQPFHIARRELQPAAIHDASYGDIEVRTCFGDVWFDVRHAVLVGRLLHECQQGGDGCIVQPTWLTARLAWRRAASRPLRRPAARGPDLPPPAGGPDVRAPHIAARERSRGAPAAGAGAPVFRNMTWLADSLWYTEQ
jgi:hypothetical protein